MNAHLVLVTMLVLGVGTPIHVATLESQKSRDVKKKAQVCWPGGEPEIDNPNPGRHRPTRLPENLANAKVHRSVMLLKLCVADTGEVDRVLVLESSGNAEVDKYYTTEMSKWTFPPVERDKRPIRTVVPVSVTLYIK